MPENVTDALKPTTKTSYFWLFIVSLVFMPFLLIALVWLANNVLPPDDASAFKGPLFGVWATITGASGLGTIIGGLMRTYGKISTQKGIAVAQSTLVGPVSPEKKTPVEKLVEESGFDLRDFDTSGITTPGEFSPELDETPSTVRAVI